MPQRIFDVLRKHGLLNTIFHLSRTNLSVSEQNGEIFTSYKIHNALLSFLIVLQAHYEFYRMIKEAIQMYGLAANIYPVKGYESLKPLPSLHKNSS